MHANAQISVRIRSERARLGLSQQQAAEAAGVRREMWAKYEAGAEPGAATLSGMGVAGVDVLFVLTGQRTPGMHPADTLTEDERRLRDGYRLCDEPSRQLLLQAVLLLAQRPVRAATRKSLAGKTSDARDRTSPSGGPLSDA